jgi:hypothetical protein
MVVMDWELKYVILDSCDVGPRETEHGVPLLAILSMACQSIYSQASVLIFSKVL